MLTLEQKKYWDENGVLILSGFYSHEVVDKLLDLQKHAWEVLPPKVVVDDHHRSQMLYEQPVR